jgi:hypothetical protein
MALGLRNLRSLTVSAGQYEPNIFSRREGGDAASQQNIFRKTEICLGLYDLACAFA